MRIKPLTSRLGLLTMTAVSALATTVACNSGNAPELATIEDKVAQVGVELRLDLIGSDADGGRLSYSFDSDIEDVDAEVTVSPSGDGVFRWTPLADSLGEHFFDFTVSDGDLSDTITVKIEVKGAVGSATAPIFRSPIGDGTELDLTLRECLDLLVQVEDQDTVDVDLTLDLAPDGMEIEATQNKQANIHWCPTREQADDQRFMLVIKADDHDNPPVLKQYRIAIRNGDGANCPGTAPTIQHTPSNESTILNLTIDATVLEDKGLKEAPLLYYSTTNPGATPNLGPGGMTQATMLEISGTPTNTVYAADVPNPVASDPAGTVRTLYYVIVAQDDDDEMGSCDHTTQSQVYQMQITSTGSANLGICARCSADAQCGTGDLCAYVGAESESYCLQSCAGGCPAGYVCSNDPVYSVDYNEALQCVPINGSCSAPNADCVDDMNEDDDNRTQASANGVADGLVSNGYVNAVLCPKKVQPSSGSKADDDWRQIVFTTDTLVDMFLDGSGEADIDLVLYNSAGGLVSKSTSLGSDEQIAQKCLKGGTYYAKVNGFDNTRSTYFLDLMTSAPSGGSCSTCVDDAAEDDNTFGQARVITLPFTSVPYTSPQANKVCPNNDDWFKVRANAGQKIITDLTFVHANGDLDIHLYSSGFFDETPCSVDDVASCAANNGQGSAAPEHMEFTATATQDYYVVIRGYAGATNSYGISIKVQ